jgi:hypothetical protein
MSHKILLREEESCGEGIGEDGIAHPSNLLKPGNVDAGEEVGLARSAKMAEKKRFL